MHLREAHVQNFRNLFDVKVAFRPGLNVLVGPNNIGKSSLLLALLHALGPGATRGEGPVWPSEDDLYRSSTGEVASTIRVVLTFADLDLTQRRQFFELLEPVGTADELSVIRLHYEAVWENRRRRFRVERWGGPDGGERVAVPPELMQNIPLTFLPALRDAEAALSPGARSRLARLLDDYARDQATPGHRESITSIFSDANAALNKHDLVGQITARLNGLTKLLSGRDFTPVAIQASDPEFTRILRALRIILPESRVPEVHSNGLGYNNLLYIATVLAHLRESPVDETPILLIEEPEAHLHPQLTIQLGEYFGGKLTGAEPPQTIVTTHSPTLASKVKPSQVIGLHGAIVDGDVRTVSKPLASVGLSQAEERQLERMLDITRASLYFARGLILVEGISEELVIPAVAKALGFDLTARQVSVVPLCGVSFGVIARILGESGLAVPAAIVTDGDPPVSGGPGWKTESPSRNASGTFDVCERVQRLLADYSAGTSLRVMHSDVTLEYDLAAAGSDNARIMTERWAAYLPGAKTLNVTLLEAADPADGALAVWRGICRARHTGSKAAYAHELAEWIEANPEVVSSGQFVVPPYLRNAITWACGLAESSSAASV